MKNKYIHKSIVLILVMTIFTNCDVLDSIDAHDSGFQLSIDNYTDKEYIGCKFYMGAFDVNNTFIAVDSLIYPDLVIFKKNEGNDINTERGFSTTFPFRESKKGINKFGFWEPKFAEILEISGNRGIVFKFELKNGMFDFTNPLNFANGSISPSIFDTEIKW